MKDKSKRTGFNIRDELVYESLAQQEVGFCNVIIDHFLSCCSVLQCPEYKWRLLIDSSYFKSKNKIKCVVTSEEPTWPPSETNTYGPKKRGGKEKKMTTE